MKLVGCFVPSLYLSGGNASECSLLLLDLLADGIEIDFDLRFENVPLRFQLRLGALHWVHARGRSPAEVCLQGLIRNHLLSLSLIADSAQLLVLMPAALIIGPHLSISD